MKRKSFLAKALLTLFAVLASFTGVRAETLTLYDGSETSTEIPANVFYFDEYTKSQFVIPAADLTALGTTPIRALTFYSSNLTAEYTTGSLVDVFLKEVEDATISDFVEKSGIVYSGTLSFSEEGELTIEFETPYNYSGGNLLVGFENTTADSFKNIKYYGIKAEGASIYGNDGSSLDDVTTVNQANFLPKVTITYGDAPTVAKPTGLVVSYTGGTEATVNWTSDESAFDIEVNGTVTEDVTSPYTLTGLSYATLYTVRVRAKNGTDVSEWSNAVSFGTEFEEGTCQLKLVLADEYGDGWNGNAAIKIVDVLSGIVIGSYSLDDGYEGTLYAEVPDGREIEFSWVKGSYDNEDSYAVYDVNDDLIFSGKGAMEEAVTYTVNCTIIPWRTPSDLAANDITATSATLSWTENSLTPATSWVLAYMPADGDSFTEVTVTANPYTLEGLTAETSYVVKVRPETDEAEKWSEELTFTTAEANARPDDLAVDNITATTAEVSWTGYADSYNLRYRTSAEGKVLFSDDFENGLDLWTVYTEGEGDGWYTFNPSSLGFESYSSGSYVAGSFSWSGSAYNADNWLISPAVELGGELTYYVRTNANYPDKYEVLLSTSGNATDNFTETLLAEAIAPNNGEWNEVNIDLSAYAGQEGYIAFHHNDYDANYLIIDDVTILGASETGEWETVTTTANSVELTGLIPETTYEVEVQAVYGEENSNWASTSFTTPEDVPTPSDLAASDVTYNTAVLTWTENGEATAWQVMLNDDEENLIAADSNPFTLTGLTPETEYTAVVRAVSGEKQSHWSEAATFTTDIQFHAPTDLAASDITTTSATISWTANETATSFELQYANAEDAPYIYEEVKYDNGTAATSIGGSSSSTWTWGVMYPGSMITGSVLSGVSIYEGTYNTEDITINIYQGGDEAPETLLYTETVTPESAGFHNVTFAAPVAINPGQNLWITLTETGTYVLVACATTEANNQWVYSGGWYNIGDLSSSLAGYGWMIRAEIGTVDTSALTWTTVSNATSPYELTGLDPETAYAVQVKAIYADGESEYTTTYFETLSSNPVPYDIAADLAADGATLTWEGQGESYNVRYRTAASNTPLFEADFNEGLDEWTIVTAGEGPGWVIGTELGINAATAYSWNGGESYNANNWLISPAVELGGMLKFSVATSSSYPDSYEVLLSTTGTDIADFTTTLQSMASATNGTYTFDLSAYSGTGYIAIHHVSEDCYLLAVYEFGVYEYVPAGEWVEFAATEATATISGLATNNLYEYQVQSVKNGSESEWSETGEFALITFDDNADNSKLISTYAGKLAHVTLSGRTLYQDNTWNTIVLPFNLSAVEVEASPLAGADIRTLDSVSATDESVTLNFIEDAVSAYGQFYGGLPYIVKWASGSDIVNPEFANVTLTTSQYYAGGKSEEDENIAVYFEGTYAPIAFDAEDTSILFVGADNKLNYPLAGARIGAFRSYFSLDGISAGDASSVKILTNLDDEDATGIAGIENASEGRNWYDLSGRKLTSKPAQKGIYVTEGRKVSVK